MGTRINRLTDRYVRNAKRRGLHCDGSGLYLAVASTGSRSWVLRYKHNGKAHDMGLGGFPDVSLADARELRDKCRRQLRDGLDPIEQRKLAEQQRKLEAARSVTFKHCAEQLIASHQAGWRNFKHGQQWATRCAITPTRKSVS